MPGPAALFASVLFSVLGFAAFRYGKKYGLWPPLAIGLTLMVYPYFVTQVWLIYLIGCVLCGALFVMRE